MGLRLKIIVNPSSGRELARLNIEDMISYLVSRNALTRADISYTSGSNDAVKFAREINPEEYDILVVAGGDGTVNEVITGIMSAKINIPIAVYTCGTVNDFSVSIGMPTQPSDFASMLMNPRYIKCDCGKINDSFFLNVAAGGLLSEVAYSVPSELKTNFGSAAYIMEALRTLGTLKNTLPIKITTDENEYNVDATLFFISNSQSVGGFRKLMAEAELNDGLLDCLILSAISYADVMPLLAKVAIGEHLESDRVIYFQTDKLTISTDSTTEAILDLDGEKGPSLPAQIECIKDALTLIVPNKED